MEAKERKNKTRIIGIDFGLKRLGIAISDEMKIIASSLTCIQAEKTLSLTLDKILNLLKDYAVEKVVIGYPLHMDGSKGILAEEAERFAKLLEKSSGLQVDMWDERLSSVQAERSLKQAGLNRKKRSKVVDQVAASYILQSYLDSRFLNK